MAVLWAAKSLQLHLLARDARDEYCGCGSDRAYGVCCRESDLSTPAPERNWWLYQAERRYLREIARGKARTFLGQLFESLVTLSVRSYAQSAEAQVRHLRTYDGRQEVDLIVERPDQRIVAVEIKLSSTVTDEDVAHLAWLRDKLGTDLLDSLVVTTGPHAYRRKDGIAVVPAALLGP